MTNELNGKKIVLIGGAGFIGYNMALSLTRDGAEVHVIDGLQVNNLLHFSTAGAGSENGDLYLKFINERLYQLRKANVAMYVQDVRDYHSTSMILSRIKPHIVVHLAAVAHAGRSNKDPYSTFDHSLRTLENTLDYSRTQEMERFIYFSSSMVYGNFLVPEVDEEQPLNPMGIYGALKVGGEKMVQAYHQVFGLPYTIVRPSALYGPGCVSRRVGQVFIESALQGNPLRVDGDGNERLDFTYIDDLIQGVKLTMVKPEARNQTFNITYGQSRTIAELVEVIRKAFPNVSLQRVERDNLMPFRGTLSIKKAQTLLGYRPENPIEIGFPKYIQWYKDILAMVHKPT
jgi:nucleoside-diphosphate-sugar epimerase